MGWSGAPNARWRVAEPTGSSPGLAERRAQIYRTGGVRVQGYTSERMKYAFAILVASIALACSDDDDTDDVHTTTSPSCSEISDSCHGADEGSGPAHECHELAHHDVEADCAAEKDACLLVCGSHHHGEAGATH